MSNENIRELAYEDYCAGLKYKEIADKYNVKLSTIKSWATRYWKKKKLQPKEKVATKSIKRLQPQNEDTSHKIVKELKDAVMSDDSLTAEQQKFCIYYVMSNNALQSYLKAYRCSYECASASAYRLLGKVRIKEKINDEKNQKIIKTNGEIHKTKANIIPLNKYKNRKTELILYSSKVVAAVGIAVLMVFNMDSIKPNLVGTKIETMKQLNNKFSISRMLQQSTEKIGAGMKNISGGIAENLEFDKGVYKDEKAKK